MISPVVTPWLASRIGWAGALSATAVLGVVAGLLWLGVRVHEVEISQSVPAPAKDGPGVTARDE
jgi:cyanate permease